MVANHQWLTRSPTSQTRNYWTAAIPNFSFKILVEWYLLEAKLVLMLIEKVTTANLHVSSHASNSERRLLLILGNRRIRFAKHLTSWRWKNAIIFGLLARDIC